MTLVRKRGSSQRWGDRWLRQPPDLVPRSALVGESNRGSSLQAKHHDSIRQISPLPRPHRRREIGSDESTQPVNRCRDSISYGSASLLQGTPGSCTTSFPITQINLIFFFAYESVVDRLFLGTHANWQGSWSQHRPEPAPGSARAPEALPQFHPLRQTIRSLWSTAESLSDFMCTCSSLNFPAFSWPLTPSRLLSNSLVHYQVALAFLLRFSHHLQPASSQSYSVQPTRSCFAGAEAAPVVYR
ncbi:hypothetical protein VTN77DRAFT_9106 [Rasamsonia byssochlamydoides]|uniref:uncharacterized protein n=1 Tax=Rasamsonia byssochlamydoides TaxID=89139 RepID=UPI003742B6C8